MKEYLKMKDRFSGSVRQEESCERQMLIDDESYYADIFSDGDYIAHAINSHDELVAEVERLRESLKWAVGNLPFENAFEWSDDENADAHYAAIRLLGVEIDE